jgi:putative salt-induced outer membrane protein YdiY
MKRHIELSVLVLSLAAGVSSVQAQVQTNTPPPKPKVKWESSATAGLTLTRGNSDSTLATLTGSTDGKWDQSELSIGADATYGRTKAPGQATATTSAELLRGFIQYNWLFGDRFYGFGRVEGLHDGVADIKYRATLSGGAGYYFIKNTNTDLSAEVGPGYVIQELGNNSTSYATVRAGEKFHQALSDRARIWQTVDLLPQVDWLNNYIVNAVIDIEADLTKDKKLSLQSYVTDTYNHVPAPARLKMT